MDHEDARQLLGVGRSATSAQLRSAYHERLRATHPDLNGGSSAAVAAVVEAYRLLAGDPAPVPRAEPPVAPPPPPAPDPNVAVVVEGDTVAADLPAGDLFPMLVAAGDAIGDVVHVDPEGGLLEVIVQMPGYGPCSVLLTLQGRAAGMTEAWCTVETLSGRPPPSTAEITALIAAGMRAIG